MSAPPTGGRSIRWGWLALALALTVATDVRIAQGRPHFLVFVWLASLALLVVSVRPSDHAEPKPRRSAAEWLRFAVLSRFPPSFASLTTTSTASMAMTC